MTATFCADVFIGWTCSAIIIIVELCGRGRFVLRRPHFNAFVDNTTISRLELATTRGAYSALFGYQDEAFISFIYLSMKIVTTTSWIS